MNTFVYLKSKKELWLVMEKPKPRQYPLGSFGREFQYAAELYNSRLHYPVSDELDALLVDGEKKNENEFGLQLQYKSLDGVSWINSDWATKSELSYMERAYRETAIPLPDNEPEDIYDAVRDYRKNHPEPTTVKPDGWISVETLPDDNKDYQVWEKGSLVPSVAHYLSKKYFIENYEDENYMEEGWYYSHGYVFDNYLPEIPLNVTHYRTLPQPPTQPAGAKPIIE